MDKYLSIITNFGCHFMCPYCITKKTGINVPHTTIEGLDLLKLYIQENNINMVSVSGGGDPLYNYDFNKYQQKWYEKLFNIISNMNVKFEMHTSYINSDFFKFYSNDCYRIVYHLNNYNQLKLIKKHNNEIIRVVYVVTAEMTKKDINKIFEFCKNSDVINELSFRQMVNENYESTYYLQDHLKKYHKKNWYYIEQCDYNIYYCENKIYTNFKDFRKVD